MTGAASASRIAVLGGGLAGLRAATALVEAGHVVEVFEARTRVGGRARGEWIDGHWMDSAWPALGARDTALVSWSRALELADGLTPLRPLQPTLLRHGEALAIEPHTLRGAAKIPGSPIWERPKLLRWNRLMARYAPLLDRDAPERAADLDYRCLRDHVALYFGRGALEFWLGPELQGQWGDDTDELSRVALLLHARGVGIGEARPALSGLPRRPLFEIAETAGERLGVVRATAVERIDEAPSGGFLIETVDGDGRQTRGTFDAVVCALGPEQAERVTGSLLTAAERDFFAALEERPVTTLAVALDGAHTGLPQEIRLPAREGSAIASLLIEPGQTGGRAPEGRSQLVLRARDVFSMRWRESAGDVVAKNLLSSLELARPGLGERVVATHLGRSQQAFFGVGAFRALAGFRRVQLDRRSLGRRLYFAGDYLGGPSFEAATRSGLRAASELIEDLEQA